MSHVVIISVMVLAPFASLEHIRSLIDADNLRTPARIAVESDGVVLATDPFYSHIARFDATGTPLEPWPVAEGRPIGIAIHPDGRHFVSLRVPNGAGGFLGKVGIYDGDFVFSGAYLGESDLVGPTDIDIDTGTGVLYVVDTAQDRVYGFDSDGTLTLMFGTRGGGAGEFRYPSAIAVDEGDAAGDPPRSARLIVADHDNFRIQTFLPGGTFVTRFGYRLKFPAGGGSEGWMPRTQGVAVDALGHIFVADAQMSSVRVFDPTGAEHDEMTVRYGEPGLLQNPCDVALTADGLTLYVANTNASSVEVYSVNWSGVPGPLRGPITDDGGSHGTNRCAMDADRSGELWLSRPAGGKSPRPKGQAHRDDEMPVVQGPDDGALLLRGYDGPHMIDSAIICGRCHGYPDLPEGGERRVVGQELLCTSCHSAGGQALDRSVHPLDKDPAYLRSHRWGVPADDDGALSAGPAAGTQMEQYLDAGDIKCATCHDQHSSYYAPYLRMTAVNSAICKSCHRDEGAPTDHRDAASTFVRHCLVCHATHSVDENVHLVRETIDGVEVAFTDDTVGVGAGGFVDLNPDDEIRGICEACHVYPPAVGPHSLDPGMGVCTGCHPHDSGFMPSGGDCTSCHGTVQDNGDGIPAGGRRAVVGEFPAGDAHAHYGAELDSAACLVCHDLTTHMNGRVELLDPDSASLYTFVTPDELASDPDLSNFCTACHDSDGAARLGAAALDPFGDGNIPPDVAQRFQGTLQWAEWYGDFCFGEEGTLRQVNSHHDIGDSDQAWSGAKIECLNCHGAHAAGASQPLVDPDEPLTAWAGSDNDFCLGCHDGGNGPADPDFPAGVIGPTIALRGVDSCDYVDTPWYVDYRWAHTAHGSGSKRGWEGYSGAPPATVDCLICHDPHGSYTPTNTLGNPYMIRDFVDGATFVDDGTRTGGWSGPPWDTTGSAREVVVAISGIDVSWGAPDGLCAVCHAGWLDAYDWHAYCTGCQTCHGHGQAFGEADFVGPDDSTPCPLPPLPGPPGPILGNNGDREVTPHRIQGGFPGRG